MRFVVAAALLLSPQTLLARGISVESMVLVERTANGVRLVEPSGRFVRGDRVVTVLSWRGGLSDNYTLTSAVPSGLELESTSGRSVQVSTDGGGSWLSLAHPDRLPRRVTHLRWQARGGNGQLSYRAIVR